MIGALVLGILAGYIARAFTPGSGVRGCLPTIAIGLFGSFVGYFIFTEALHIGDASAFDLGGLPGAIIGTIIVLAVVRAIGRHNAPRPY